MWIWFIILFTIGLISFAYSFSNYVPLFTRFRYINKLIDYSQAKREHRLTSPTMVPQYPMITTNQIGGDDSGVFDIHRRKHFVHWLQRDGVFLLHLIHSHIGEKLTIQILEDLMEIWKDNYEDKSRLAQQLLQNQFHFQ